MDDFVSKWKKDNKFRTKVKLGLYVLFIVIVSVYALSLNSDVVIDNLDDNIDNNVIDKIENKDDINEKDMINVSNIDKKTINIRIDEDEIIYKITYDKDKETIIKEYDDKIEEYIYEDGEFYLLSDGEYIITTIDMVYDVIKYNYLDLSTINKYLEKAKNNNQQYMVYLEDVILGVDSDDYFIIQINGDKINVDYTPMIKYFSNDINGCFVDMVIERE